MVFVVCLVAYSWRSSNFCCGYYANSFLRFFSPGCYRESGTLSCGYCSDKLVFKPILKSFMCILVQLKKLNICLKKLLGIMVLSLLWSGNANVFFLTQLHQKDKDKFSFLNLDLKLKKSLLCFPLSC